MFDFTLPVFFSEGDALKIRVGSLLDLSTVDWLGHRTFMIFCGGCNFRCPFCDNSQLIPSDSGGEVDLEVVEERVAANIGFLDAVGFTGGEPTLQPEPVKALCSWAKSRGLKTFLNTNGSQPRFVDEMLRSGLLDYVAMDVKAPLDGKTYGRVAGLRGVVDEVTASIRETMELCAEARVPVEFRTTIVPTLMDDEGSVREIAGAVRGRGIYVLQEFFPFEDILDERLRSVKPPERMLLVKLARAALETGAGEVYIRTRGGGMERITL